MDTMEGKAPVSPAPAAPDREKQVAIDRFVVTRKFEEREEEEKVEAAMALYEKAARARVPDSAPPDPVEIMDSEELEAMSQQLKLQQKCQDIAALMMVEELEDELEEEEEPRPRRKQREV